MNTNEAKRIRIEEYLHSLGYSPARQQGDSLWYKSPFRDECEPSFKVNTERNLWYDSVSYTHLDVYKRQPPVRIH